MSQIKFCVNLFSFTGFGDAFDKMLDYVRTAEATGYDVINAMDHVVGIIAERHGGIAQTPYTAVSTIDECMTLLAYLSAVTSRITLSTRVLALPQRQAVVLAKQAAQIDRMSGGRLRLGIGIGYNAVEFEAAGASFPDRAKRFEEQIDVMRTLWTQDDVTYTGAYHTIRDASLSPLPLQRPIPLWFGIGRTITPIPPDKVLERVGRLADGWLPLFRMGPEAREAIAKVHAAARAAGRDPANLPMEMDLYVGDKTAADSIERIKKLREFGATHIHLTFADKTPEGQIESLKRFGDVLAAFA